jgi:catechol 2,3-dioxygenase-like lactoylglutathione lyase family enzyme
MFKAANTTVMVKDMDNAIAFYTDVLGLPTGMRHGNNYAEIKAPGVIIGLHPDRGHVHKKLKAGNLSIGFEVANIERVVKSLESRGITFTLQENDTNKFAFFSDPDGTPLYLVQPKSQ